MFEYHTYLHHSQTGRIFDYHPERFEYHTYLHHSQTEDLPFEFVKSLNTIHIYIILKPSI